MLLLFRATTRWRRERRIQRDLGVVNGLEHGPARAGVSAPLQRVAAEARTLRLRLETPVRRVRPPLLSESPWRRRERCDEYDSILVDLRRGVWDWLRDLERLDAGDRQRLAELGLSPAPFRRMLFRGIDRTDDPWEQVLWAAPPDLDRLHRELLRTIQELARFERAVGERDQSPYRAAG